MDMYCSLTSLVVVLCFVFAVDAQRDEKKHLEYRRRDEVTPGEIIGNIPQDAHFNYDSNVMFSLRYDIVKGDQKEYFDIDDTQGILKVTRMLDRDVLCPQLPTCNILLDVAIVHPFFEIIKVTLTLADENDNDPYFPEPEITLELSENAAPPVSFVLPSAVDPDSGLFGVQSYEIYSESSAFGLQSSDDGSGLRDVRLQLKEKLNREEEDMYEVYIIAKDGGKPPRSGTMTVHVHVIDANDNSPTFEVSLYNVSLYENNSLHIPFLQVKATDPDGGLNGQVVYSIAPAPQIPSQNENNMFAINNITGEISLIQKLDYEEQRTHHLLVAAEDLGPDSVPVHAKVIVHVQDVNDFIPEIHVNSWAKTGYIEVVENAQPGTFVAHVSVEDRDLGLSGQVTCHVADERFALEILYANTYKMITKVSLDRETQEEMVVSVICEDHGDPPLSSSTDVTVKIVDENDHSPEFIMNLYRGRVPENSPLGYSVLRVTAKDNDTGDNAKITYHLHANSNNLMKVDPVTGIITTNSALDYESSDHMEFYVFALDGGTPARSATATVSVVITDVNDEPPRFLMSSYNFGTYENRQSGTEIGRVIARDIDSPPYDEFLYSIQDNKAFSIDPGTGVITTKKILDREHQMAYYLTAKATDVEEPYLSGTVTVTIYVTDENDNAPRIVSPAAGNQTFEVSVFAPTGYIITTVKASDADQNSQLQFSIAKGNKDQLFKIDPNLGTISLSEDLAKTSQDAFPLLIMVQDRGNKSATAALNIFINRTEAFAKNIDMNSVVNMTMSVPPAATSGLRLRSQDVILIILAAITVVLVSILITAIVCIKKKQRYRDRDSYKYMCRIDLANHISATQAGKNGEPVSGSRRASVNSMDEDVDLEKGEFVRFDPRDSGIPAPSLTGSYSDMSNGSQVALQTSAAHGPEPPDRYEDLAHAHPAQAPVWTTNGDKPMAVQHVLNVMPVERDSDSTSGCSADMSNSDGSKCPHDTSEIRPITTNGRAHKKPCPTHGKNVTFGEVTCHSPTRDRDYATCPLPQCGATHRSHRLHNTLGGRPGPHHDDRYDDRTGCHGGASSIVAANNKKQTGYSTPPNSRIHPQPPLVLKTFGYDESNRRSQAENAANQNQETVSLLRDSKRVQSVDV